MPKYKARKNSVYDETGKQILLVLPSNCTKKLAVEMAKVVAEHMNKEEENELDNRKTDWAGLVSPKRL